MARVGGELEHDTQRRNAIAGDRTWVHMTSAGSHEPSGIHEPGLERAGVKESFGLNNSFMHNLATNSYAFSSYTVPLLSVKIVKIYMIEKRKK